MTRHGLRWYGPLLRAAEAGEIARRLLRGADPGGPDVPWAVAVRDEDGTVAVACSTMLPSGVFWAMAPAGPVIGTDPLTVAHAIGPVRPDTVFLAAFADRRVPGTATPYAGVHRLPAGNSARWSRGDVRPSVWSWIEPDLARPPDLSGVAAQRAYLEAFDTVIDDLVRRSGPTAVATLSAGLDSTFVVGTLLRHGVDVHALTHRPLPGAGRGNDDEFPLAGLLATGSHEAVVNRALVRPLVAARAAWQSSGVPVHAPDNQAWISAMDHRVHERGAAGLWVGAHGNASFSHTHPYAASYYLRRRRCAMLLEVASAADRRGVERLRAVGASLRRHPDGRAGRDQYLQWLVRSNSALSAAANPAACPPRLDPFCARRVLQVAARIEPAEWLRGELPRAFARRVAEGRVPDPIRLRTKRFRQGADAWFVIRADRDDYLHMAEGVVDAPGLEHIDGDGLMDVVRRWPWGEVGGPPLAQVHQVNRVLALADFARGIGDTAATGTLLVDPARVAPIGAP